MKVSIIGTGYVGLVAAAVFADYGNDVVCADIDSAKIEALRRGEIPIYEPGLDALVAHNVEAGRLRFTDSNADAAAHADVIFLAVGTPTRSTDGSADLTYLMQAAVTVAKHLTRPAIIVDKSTVPVGTAERVARLMAEHTDQPFVVASNPEFLKEGSAVDDFMHPDRVIIGTTDPRAREVLRRLYQPFCRTSDRMIFMDARSAELTKYACNAYLATRVSFINDIANLADAVGADVELVRRGMGSDPRIGNKFLFPGVGYGGSCFPKDIQAMMAIGRDKGYDTAILRAVDEVNHRQKSVLFDKLSRHFGGDLKNRKIAVWGLAFKPRTDDIREAPSLELLRRLIAAGADVHVHDPVAMDNVRGQLGDAVTYHDHQYDTLAGAEALAIVTEWNEYRNPDFGFMRHKMKSPVICDGRNIYDARRIRQLGFTYSGIGLGGM